MLRRLFESYVYLYQIEVNSTRDIILDINNIINEIDIDGIYPVTISWQHSNGNTYSQLRTDIIYLVHYGDFIGVLEHPIGLSVDLDDRYTTVNVNYVDSQSMMYINSDHVYYLDTFCTDHGNIFNAYSISDESSTDALINSINNIISTMNIPSELNLVTSAADFKQRLLDRKLIEINEMKTSGNGTDRLAENPFEDIYYSMDSYESHEPYIGRGDNEEINNKK